MRTVPLTLAGFFLKIFLRDRQAIFFSLFFPLIFMLVFSFMEDSEPEPLSLGVVNESDSALSRDMMELLVGNPQFLVSTGSEAEMREALMEGEATMVVVIPDTAGNTASSTELDVLVDAAQVRQLNLILPLLEQTLLGIERELRGTEPLFSINTIDVQARSQRYIDFLLPGLLAFTLMQVAIAGSGFNIVEYRRKGILKRLFVTPIRPSDFIAGIVLSRTVVCLIQLTVLLVVAIVVMDVSILGSYIALYTVIIAGTLLFLCLGFMLGSLAKTQQSIMAIGNLVIFPQIFLSGVFYPVDSMPALIQPVASVLPLTFVADALRSIASEGAALTQIPLDLAGIAFWLVVAFLAATRFFVWKDVAL
jgi:ABC-2 type transport system permease protein